MSTTKTARPKTRRRFATIWAELEYVCAKVHHWLHKQRSKPSAKRYQRRLERILSKLPENDLAILREEGLSLLCELKDETPAAIRHRKREISLIERLHESVNESTTSGKYDDKMAASILSNWSASALRQRQAILRNLQSRNGHAGNH